LVACIEERQEPVFGYPLMNFEDAEDEGKVDHNLPAVNKPIVPEKYAKGRRPPPREIQ